MYPGLGNYKGLINWQSSNQNIQSLAESRAAIEANKTNGVINQYDREVAFANERFAPIFEAYYKQPIPELAKDPEALKIGQRLFSQNCSQCHGSDDWLYGGSPEKITETLINGRKAMMPAQLVAHGEDGIQELVAYVLSLSDRKLSGQKYIDDPSLNQLMVEGGQARSAVCAACHGQDGKGNQLIGAPNLTDQIWLYGGTDKSITETLRYGRNGVMPAFKTTLGEKKIHLVSAYVFSLSQDK